MTSMAKRSLDIAVLGHRMALRIATIRALSAVAGLTKPFPKHGRLQPAAIRPFSTTSAWLAEEAKPIAVETPPVPGLTHDQVMHILSLKLTPIIDVRKPEEFAKGHIPFAHLLPVDDVESAMRLGPEQFLKEYGFNQPSEGSTIIVYCHSGKRAERAAKIFRDKFKLTNVFNYRGSWSEWSEKYPQMVVMSNK